MATEQEVIPWWGYPLLPLAFLALLAIGLACEFVEWHRGRRYIKHYG